LQIIFQNCSKNKKINGFSSSNYSQVFNKTIINVHGVIDRFLTLGLNDETQLASDFFEKDDLNDLLKPNSLENSREYRRRNAKNTIENSDIIVIFGMSIGSTDKHWWEKIAEVLLKAKNKKLIIHLYEKEPSYLSSRKVRLRRKQTYIVTNSEYIINTDLKKYLNQVENKKDNIIDFETKDNKISEKAT
jgi:hypothetical protein